MRDHTRHREELFLVLTHNQKTCRRRFRYPAVGTAVFVLDPLQEHPLLIKDPNEHSDFYQT